MYVCQAESDCARFVFVTRRPLAALIHKAFGTCFRHLYFLGPSPLWLSTFSKETRQPEQVCVCLCARLVACDPFLHVSFSAGISLLVPHGGIAEDTTWEMYMIINQEDSR